MLFVQTKNFGINLQLTGLCYKTGLKTFAQFNIASSTTFFCNLRISQMSAKCLSKTLSSSQFLKANYMCKYI